MQVSSLNLFYFSPTGTTKSIITSIAQGLSVNNITTIELTYPNAENIKFKAEKKQVNIIGVPVYGGRIAPVAKQRMQKIKADNSLAILIAVYGNREFEDALLELKNITESAGFIPIAAGAFIGEHSFSDEKIPIAQGRPDSDDLRIAKEFGAQVRHLIENLNRNGGLKELNVPGNYPYKQLKKSQPISPETDKLKCVMCGICRDACPTNAIQLNGEVYSQSEKCTWCCACIKKCPNNARYMDHMELKKIKEWLFREYSKRKEPDLFYNV